MNHKLKLRIFKNRPPEGFTLIEMILVVSLMAMIGLALYQSIANGINIWQRAQRSSQDEDVVIFLERANFDLRNAIRYSLLKFAWQEDSISIPTIVTTRMDKSISGQRIDFIKQMGRVEYYFDKGKKAIFRRQANYGQAMKNKFGPPQVVVPAVVNARFVCVYAKKTDTHFIETGEAGFPAAVKIELEIVENSGRRRNIQRLFNIPVGTLL